MHSPIWLAYAFRGAAALAFFTTCSSGDASEAPSRGGVTTVSLSAPRQTDGAGAAREALLPGLGATQFPSAPITPLDEKTVKLPGNLVYVSYPFQYLVAVYDLKGKSLGNIGYIAVPQGIFVDSGHNLWVTQPDWFIGHGFPQMPTVLEFKRGETRPSKTLLDPAGSATDVTVCPNGTVYIANSTSISSGRGNVQVYAGGSAKPTGTLTYPDGFFNLSVTCDAAGNVFSGIASKDYKHAFVVGYPGGKQAGATRIIDNTLAFGIKPDNAGNLLVNNSVTSSVCEYTEAGRPTGICVNTSGGSYNFAVRSDGKEILSANYGSSVTASFQFPGGALGELYPGYNQPFGTAYDPGQGI